MGDGGAMKLFQRILNENVVTNSYRVTDDDDLVELLFATKKLKYKEIKSEAGNRETIYHQGL